MKLALRVDASATIGLGHLRRCLSLADALASAGADVVFVTRDLGVDASTIERKGFEAIRLPAPPGRFRPAAGTAPHAEWAGVAQADDAQQTIAALHGASVDAVLVDHYAFDAAWHRGVADALGARLAVIDDLADRPLYADLLIDHNWAADHRAKYAGTRSHIARVLGGPRHALLDAVYRDAPRYEFRRELRSIGIFVGATDIWNASPSVLQACREVAGFDRPIEIATTHANPHLAALRDACERQPPTRLLVDLPSLHEFFARHDLQIGAGGGAAWERCCIGAPTLALTLAANQRVVNDALASLGVARIASADAIAPLGAAIALLVGDAPAREAMARAGRRLVDGDGARRVALALCADELALRDARADDAALALAWRNDPLTHRWFRDPSPVTTDDHERWWQRTLGDRRHRLLVAHAGSIDVGMLRLDLDGEQAEVSLYLDPALTGLGLGHAMLRACRAGSAALSLRRLIAEVHPDNAASVGAFAKAGFVETAPRRWTLELNA